MILTNVAPGSSPRNITVFHTSPSSVAVYWDAPLPEYHNGIINSYQLILVEEYSGRSWTLTSTARSYQLNYLQEYHQYTLTVAAETVSLGPHSPPLRFRTLPASKSTLPHVSMQGIY